MDYQGSQLESIIKKSLKGEYGQIKSLWSVSPYDWGNLKTNQQETVNIGKDCTLVCLAKLGNKDYRFIVIHSKQSKRPDYVVNTKGYPITCVTTYQNGQSELFAVRRTKIFSK